MTPIFKKMTMTIPMTTKIYKKKPVTTVEKIRYVFFDIKTLLKIIKMHREVYRV